MNKINRMKSARPMAILIVTAAASVISVHAAGACGAAYPQAAALSSSPEVVAVLDPLRAKYEIPGLVGAILTGDKVAHIGAVGVRKLGAPQLLTIQDKMHLGSCTKAMTATLIAVLVEQGKLKWTTTIAEVFPELKDSMNADFRGVTLDQLLTHTGGVPADLNADGLWGRLWRHTGTPTEQRHTLLEGVIKNPPIHTPGTKFTYSNAGFAIAGHMAEKVTGKAWETLMQEMLFSPLGMTSAGFGAPGDAGKLNQPVGHAGQTGNLRPVDPGPGSDNPAAIGPGGTVHSSVGDWAKFVALHDANSKRPPKLLKPETMQKLHTPPAGQEYAMGWGVTQREWGGRVLTHAGSNTMWYCIVWASPEKDFAVLVACNCAHETAAKACDEAAWGLIQLHQKQK